MTDSRSRLELDERRAQLLEVGMRLFIQRSYDDVQVSDIAAEAGVSKGLLYHYFGGKRALYVATVGHSAGRLLEAIQVDGDVAGHERLTLSLNAYFDFVAERSDAYRGLMQGGLGADPEILAILQRTRAAIVWQTCEAVGLCEPRPAFRVAVFSWIGAVEAALSDWQENKDVPREQLVGMLSASLFVHLSFAAAADPDAQVVLEPLTGYLPPL
ncbi:MAG: TetR family transcriptional regulator [Rhodobacterales bacterium]|nr:TetR family transcriptional regulator [Rhodobacterales bacterium]